MKEYVSNKCIEKTLNYEKETNLFWIASKLIETRKV